VCKYKHVTVLVFELAEVNALDCVQSGESARVCARACDSMSTCDSK
jgi:hypothetical protein